MGANAERRRKPPDDDRLKRQLRQCVNGFTALEALLEPDAKYFAGDKIGQADVTIAVGMTFIEHIFPGTMLPDELPKLHAMAARAELLPAFSSAQID